MLQGLALSSDTVDVSMATLASVWACDPCDLGERQHEPQTVWESGNCFCNSAPAGVMWMEQLSPHLQRNKQLQDTLLQREEELAQLQEENNKLREFLNSSFVKDLQKKAKELTAEGRMKRKRNLMFASNGPSHNGGHQLGGPEQVSKRLCRNLTAEICSEVQDTSATSESNLEFWVLRMLGLKDRDTIDTSDESLCSFGSSLRSLVYDNAVISSSEHPPNSTLSPSVTSSIPLSAPTYCQNAAQTQYQYRAECQKANGGNSAKLPENCPAPPDQLSDFGEISLNGPYGAPDVVTGGYNTLTAFHPAEERAFAQSEGALSEVLPFQGNQEERSAYRSPPQGRRTSAQDTAPFSPPGPGVQSSSSLTLHQVTNPPWMPIRGCNLTSDQPPATTPRTDLAFSMSLSPSSSVKTLSFPQGQAFVRKDGEGRWNFTWVPRQGP